MIYAILILAVAALAATTISLRISDAAVTASRVEAASRRALLRELAAIPPQLPTQSDSTAYTATESVEN